MADARIATYIDFLLTGGQIENLPKPITLTEQAMYNYCKKTAEGGFATNFRKGTTNIEYTTDGGTTWKTLIAIADLKGPKGDTGATGATGKAGTNGTNGAPGAKGDPGAAGVGVKSIALTKDANGAITAGTWTDTANASHTITISAATA